MKKLVVVALLAGLSFGCPSNESDSDNTEQFAVAKSQPESPELLPLVESKTVKNVILLIGDGTGLAQITSGQYALVGPDGLLHMQTMPVTGFVKTHAADDLITYSAESATAYACGLKTNRDFIGLNTEKIPCKTILELAEEKGLSTGLVSTSSITHATPASFAAHVESRDFEDEIAYDFLDSGVEVFLGGGLEFFEAKARTDSMDLISEFSKSGYQILRTRDDLERTSSNRILGLFAADGMERTEKEPSSDLMIQKALDILSQDEDGFFLMMEGSQIDWAGHDNEIEYLINEIRDFDAAVKIALDFAQKDGETLVVLTADHETGGMTLQRQLAGGDSLEINWATGNHSGIPVPLMAYGPQATEFMGWRDNSYVGKKIAELLGFEELPILINN